MADLWNVETQAGTQENASYQVQQQSMTQQQVRDEASDVYQLADANSLSNSLPLIIAAYPSEAANTLRIATDLGTASLATSTATLDVTLPGSDILVEMSADIKWTLPAAAYSVSSGASTASSSGTESASHTHNVDLTSHSHTVSISGHTHALDGSGTMPVAGTSDRVTAATELHTHKFLSSFGGGGDGFGDGGWAYKDVDGEYLVMGSTSNHSDKHTWAPDGTVGDGFFFEVYVSGSNHTHSLTGTTSQSGGSSSPTSAGGSESAKTSANPSVTHSHNIAHTHTVGATSAALDVRVELVVDTTVVTAGLSQFHVEGFTGASGSIQLRSVYILRKAYADALSAGQHTVGLQFTVSTTAFIAASTVDANNIALILRDASFDERVQIFTP